MSNFRRSGGRAVSHNVVRGLLLTLLTACPPAVAAQQVPTPQSVLGFRVGQDSMLASWQQITGYFTRLAAASNKVRVDTLGPSTQGRPVVVVTISDPANLARRAAIMAAQRRLADPRLLDSAETQRLVRTQPAVILIQCSIHSTEIAASQMSMELAWRLATDSALGSYLRDVVVLLIPSPNPDGVDIVGDWYRDSRGTPWLGTSPPWLYHPYAGHDNNRDWYMLTQVETQEVTRLLYRQWFPLVFYDVHQMGGTGTRMFVPPFADPVNPNIDALVVGGINLVGATMAQALLDAGHTGIAQQQGFDLWWHGGARTVPARHNMIGLLTEAASARLASPLCVTAAQVRQPARGNNYPAPWTPGCWRLRDIVDYELVTSTALVRQAAEQRDEFVRRFVASARRQIEAGRSAPTAFVLPPGGDQARRALLANLLLAAGVEVHQARAPFRAGGREYGAGTLVVRMDQPFRAHAKDLLEVQHYPERRAYPGGPQLPPYDVAGWTLPLQMGVAVDEVNEPLTADLERVDTVAIRPGQVSGRGTVVLLDNTANAHVRATWSALAAGASVQVAPAEFTAGGRTWPAGTLVVRGGRAAVEAEARRGGFDAVATGRVDLPAGGAVRGVPRVALYQSWSGRMDEGWPRWVLGRALREFVENGGTVIALDQAARFAISRLGAPARVLTTTRGGGGGGGGGGDDDSAATAGRFYAPGSIFETLVDQRHPIAAGYGDRAAVYFISSVVLEAGPGARAVLSYPTERSPLLSGFVEGEELLAGKPALIDAPVGRGRVILFGFRPQHRGQTHGTFRLLTNAILYGASTRQP